MIRALWTASTGMQAQQVNMDVIANNLANVNSTGFKKSRPDFQDILYQTSKAAGTGVEAERSVVRRGPLDGHVRGARANPGAAAGEVVALTGGAAAGQGSGAGIPHRVRTRGQAHRVGRRDSCPFLQRRRPILVAP